MSRYDGSSKNLAPHYGSISKAIAKIY